MLLLAAMSLFALEPTTETEKWVGPVLTSSASLAATFFAYLTARDRLRYDSSMQIRDNQIVQLQKESAECGRDRRKQARQINRLARNVMALASGKPMPFPDENGLPHHGDEEEAGDGS